MDIASVTAQATSSTARASEQLTENFDTFLTLLTAQLQNQDPLEPLDTNEFTGQLVQYTEVEQSIQTNDHLEALLNQSAVSSASYAVSYVGREIEAEGNTAALVNGEAQWSYSLAANAQNTSLTVADANGRLVYAAQGATGVGDHTFTWDGRDANGVPLADGQYTLTVSAKTAEGNAVSTSTRIEGRVTGVDLSGTEVLLEVDGTQVPVASVLKVRDPNAG